MPNIIDGKKIANDIIQDLKNKVSILKEKPTLCVIIAGQNEASKIYVKNKIKKAQELGFNSILKELDENVTKEELFDTIRTLNNDENINGILLQLPLPKHLSEKDFLDEISPVKDVDGFNTYNSGKLFKGEKPYAIPCTPKGIMGVLKLYDVQLEGKTSIVIGRSNIVGKPIASLLLKENATVIQAHSKTKNLKELTKIADIVVSATGQKEFITGDMIKDGAVCIDVGIVRDENGKIKGDFEFNSISKKASLITPVPGGIGPLTIANLMVNTYELYLLQKGLKNEKR